MKLTKLISKSGLSFGLIFASISLVSGGVGMGLIWKAMKSENTAYIQQSIGDTTLILAAHFRTEFDHYVEQLTEVGTAQLHPLVNSRKKSTEGQNSNLGVIETDPEIMDISLWKRSDPTSAFDLTPPPMRAYRMMNSRYPDPAPDLTQQLQTAELSEKNIVQQAFEGKTVIYLSPAQLGQKNVACIAVPMPGVSVQEIIVAHLRLDKFQKALIGNRMVSGLLVDDAGNVLARPGIESFGKRENVANFPLFHAMRSSGVGIGQDSFSDNSMGRFFGGYSRIGIGQLAVLATVPEEESSLALRIVQKQAAVFLGVGFFIFLFVGYFTLNRFKNHFGIAPQSQVESGEWLKAAPVVAPIIVLYGSIRHLDQFMNMESPADTVDCMNQYFTIAESAVKEYGGIFDRISDTSFVGIWGVPGWIKPTSDGMDTWRALRCALTLRKDFFQYNEGRKVDGLKPLSVGMGIHSGLGLVAQLGSQRHTRTSAVGEVVNCAKALSGLSSTLRTDLLISHDLWQYSESRFQGERMGEARLTSATGLTGIYALKGYINEQGEVVAVEATPEAVLMDSSGSVEQHPEVFVQETKNLKWLINNGSQILGPLTEKEIAVRLFSQELDFDCECWSEGIGKSSQIKDAGIFSGSDDPQADLWMYDGETIHGPVTAGFIKTAFGHGAIQNAVFLCHGSTIRGWEQLTFENPIFTSPTEAVAGQTTDPQKKAG